MEFCLALADPPRVCGITREGGSQRARDTQITQLLSMDILA